MPDGMAIAQGGANLGPRRLIMGKHSQNLPPHLSWAMALAVCERLDAAERDQLKSYAALLIARHVIRKARQRTLPPGPARTGPGVSADPV
jgi:hypothetical protein